MISSPGLLPFRHLYLHIPFCRHKCGYCDFNAYAGMERLMTAYVEGLVCELEGATRKWSFERLRTVYLGGGTPSLLPPPLALDLLRAVGRIFELEPDAEVTLEANPASTDLGRLAAWREGGVNRLSLGVQGFDPRALGVLERRTDGAQAATAFRSARTHFDNLSVDLIYAVPFQDPARWRDTLLRAIDLEPDHLSCYCLTFEEGTLLHRRVREGRLPEVDPDRQWEFLEIACEELERAGFRRYEVSSWARAGRESRHNRAYWECRPVYGAGAGAHSYCTDGERAWRWWNRARPNDYIQASGSGGGVIDDGEELSRRQVGAEALMLGLRTLEGIRPPPGFEVELTELEAAGLVERRQDRLRPTRRGMDLHNQIALRVL